MLTVTKKILVSAPKESVALYLRDLKNLAEYESKVKSVEVSYPDADSGLVEVSGRFLGLPWKGSFKMEFTRDGGFRSEMVRGPLSKMTGGFHLRPVLGGTLVTHDEQYQFGVFLRPLSFLLKRWLNRTVELELGAIKEGAERVHRQLQLKQIEAAL